MKRDAQPSSSSPEGFLSRWSRLKRASDPDGAAVDEGASPLSQLADRGDGSVDMGTTTRTPTSAPADAHPPLPAIDTLTFDSDYTAFFQPRVPDDLRRAAVKKLFADPHFNVMDGLDVYIDDYSKPDPLPEGWLAKIAHARDLIDHPSNRKPDEDAMAIEPVPIEPTPIEPSPMEPSPMEPSPMEPSPMEPSPIEPMPIEPSPVPIEPIPIEPVPSEPAPIDALPIEPAPVEAVPVAHRAGSTTKS